MEVVKVERFWAYAVIAAAVWCAVLVVAASVRPTPVRAAAGEVRAFASGSRVFLLDESQQVLLMYGKGGGRDETFTLLAGRKYDADAAVAAQSKTGLPFNAEGYSPEMVKKWIER